MRAPYHNCFLALLAICPPPPFLVVSQVDRVKHGVDLLGRDHALLGRVLAALAGFAEAAAGSPAVTPLAGATLELIRAPQVGQRPSGPGG